MSADTVKSGRSENRRKGYRGEELACEYLRENGYTLVDRNVYIGGSEIDIIAREEGYLVFIEVKTRSYAGEDTGRFGRPARAVNYTKRRLFRGAVGEYIRVNGNDGRHIRLDVIEIYKKPTAGADFNAERIVHIKSAIRDDR